ncbi:hypothetical protein B0O99DRAFT_680724 [Bisporella sp. PMI_857]|nr:hypothetical protein B0O99DRAFT_680724 [Bisporella sp. PMI_857]
MLSILRKCMLISALAVSVTAGPVVVRSTDLQVYSTLEDRGLPSIRLGNFDLTTSHVNQVLFDIGAGSTSGRVGDAYRLKVECVDCRTWGQAVISTAGVDKKEDIIGDIISFFENPVDAIVEAFDLNVKVSLDNVGGHFDFNILATNTGSYSFPIFTSNLLSGLEISEDISFGAILSIDLVFSLSATLDIDAGFEFAFPEGAYIAVDPISGNIVDFDFGNGEIDNLPVTVNTGSATLKAALRVRVQAGTTVELFGTGFDFELGVFADLIEYVATISTTDVCALSIVESIDLNVGAYAHAVVSINYKEFGASPAVITTLLEYPLPSLCITRPAATSLLELPTAAASITNSQATVTASPVEIPAISSLVVSTVTISSSGGIFLESSNSAISSTSVVVLPSPTGVYGNNTYPSGTITSAASLTTSTVYATDLITITACANTVLHCPASLTSQVVITSTKILYTTVCPVGATLPTTIPSTTLSTFSSAQNTIAALPPNNPTTVTHLTAPHTLQPLQTPNVEIIYTPTFVNPTYILPTATIFTVAHPNWNATLPTYTPLSSVVIGPYTSVSSVVAASQTASTITVLPTALTTKSGAVPASYHLAPSAGTATVGGQANGTVPTRYPTTTEFTGAGSRNAISSLLAGSCILLMALI